MVGPSIATAVKVNEGCKTEGAEEGGAFDDRSLNCNTISYEVD